MKVIAAINGRITSEASALYALEYARVNGFTLVLFHIKNSNDPFDSVERSIETIEEAAAECGVEVERDIHEVGSVKTLIRLIHAAHVDIVFCSTRARRRLWSQSFSEKLVDASPGVDIAVVHVVHVGSAQTADSIVMPINSARLSVQKFAFFTSMLKAYEAEGTILSINVVNTNALAKMTLHSTKTFFKEINYLLAHYLKLSALMGLPVRIKHILSESERNSLLNYLGSCEDELMVIGGTRLSFFSRMLGEKPIDKILRESSVNAIAYYEKVEL